MAVLMTTEMIGYDEMASRIGVPSSTLRRWGRLFRRYLGGRMVGRVEKFPDDAVEAFKTIARLYEGRRTTEEVRDELARMTPTVIEVEDQVRQVAPGGAELVAVLDRIATGLERLVETQTRTLDLVARLAVTDLRKVRASTKPEDRTRIAAQVVELRRGGMTWRQIQEQLAKEGITRHKRTLQKIFRRG